MNHIFGNTRIVGFQLGLLFFILFFLTISCKKEVKKNSPPKIEIISPSDDVHLTAGDTVLFKVNVSDVDDNIEKVVFYINHFIYSVDTEPPYECLVEGLKHEYTNFQAVAYDEEKLTNTAHRQLIVYCVSYFSGLDIGFGWNAKLYEGDSAKIYITGYNTHSKIIRTDVYIDEEFFHTDTASVFILPWNNLVYGDHTIKAIFTDDVDSTASHSQTCFVDENPLPVVNLSLYASPYPGGTLKTHLAISDNGKIINAELFVDGEIVESYTEEGEYEYIQEDLSVGNHEVYATAVDDQGAVTTTESHTFEVISGFRYDTDILNLLATDSPEMVYGIDKTNHKLLLINPKTQSLLNEIEIPLESPSLAKYSVQDNSVFITSNSIGEIAIFDANNSTMNVVTFSANSKCKVLEIDDEEGRIFLALEDAFIILDMDSYEVLLNMEIENESMAIDVTHHWLFVKQDNNKVLDKYSLEDDTLLLIQTHTYDFQFYYLNMRPDDVHLFFSSYYLDPYNIEEIIGDIQISTSPYSGCFNQSCERFYRFQDSNIEVYSTSNYFKIDEISLPKYCDKKSISINSDNSYLTVFVNNIYPTSDNGSIVFIELAK